MWLISFAFGTIKLFVYLVGLSTTPEDTEALPAKGRAVLRFISDQPAWGFYGFFIVLGGIGLWLAFWVHRQKDANAEKNEQQITEPEARSEVLPPAKQYSRGDAQRLSDVLFELHQVIDSRFRILEKQMEDFYREPDG